MGWQCERTDSLEGERRATIKSGSSLNPFMFMSVVFTTIMVNSLQPAHPEFSPRIDIEDICECDVLAE